MAWNNTVTNAGTALLAQWAQGGTMTITAARAGTDKVAVAQLMAQTGVSGTAHALTLAGYEAVDGGVRYKLLITPEVSAYSISQIGIFGKLGSGSEVLIAIYQCETGSEIAVPASADMPDFAYSFGAVVYMDNTGTLSVTVDTTAFVTQGDFNDVADALTALGDPVAVAHGGTGGATAGAARENLSAAGSIGLSGSTFSALYAQLTAVQNERAHAFYATSTAMGVLTSSKVSAICSGVVLRINRSTGNIFDFFAGQSNSQYMYKWRVTFSVDGTSGTVGTVYRLTGTSV